LVPLTERAWEPRPPRAITRTLSATGVRGYAIGAGTATNSTESCGGAGTSNAEIGEASSSGLSRPRVARQYLGASSR
jgi:hypothetical protein